MKRRILFFLVVGLVLFLAVVPVFTQSAGKIIGNRVTIAVNVPNPLIFVDDRAIKGNVAMIATGPHTIRVAAPGFNEWAQNVNVTGEMTLNVTLLPIVRGFPLTVVPNVNGAAIFVDGAQVPSNPVTVPPGPHTIQVTAAGYQDFTASVNVAGPLTVQARLVPAGFPVTIQTNAPNAQIFVDGAQISGNVVNVAPGPHNLRVSAPGFMDFNTTINVNGPLVVQAPLGPAGIPLTVQTNVPGAVIMVDGAQIAGNVANVRRGRHVIRVTAPGYKDFNTSVNVAGPLVVNAPLVPAGVALTVTSNVQGASVAINNVVKGVTPYSEPLPAGSYTVTVSAPGYSDFVTTVSLAQPTTINAQLRAGVATLALVIPEQYIERQGREGPGQQLKLFIDGKQVNLRRERAGIEVTSGLHRIVLTSGALTVQAADFDFESGVRYEIELYMDLQVKPAN